jgi:hypothetical protein
MRERTKILASLCLLISVSLCCTVLEIVHRHAFGVSDNKAVIAKSSTVETQTRVMCTICVFARHLSSSAIESFQLFRSSGFIQLHLLEPVRYSGLPSGSLACRAPPTD